MRHPIIAMIAGLLLLLPACTGALHHVPKPTEADKNAAETEVLAEPDLEMRRAMTYDEASRTLASAVRRVHPAAQQVCREIAAGNCYWRYRMSRDRSLNASASVNGTVTLHRGLAELTANEDEIAFVVAHELGHHAANHPIDGNANARVGALLGGVMGAALDVATGGRGSFAHAGATLGQKAGWLTYSKEHEREADYLGVVIAYRAGIDLDKARGVMLTMTRSSGRRESGPLDSHPVGPERLAAFDRAVAEVRAANGALPPRAR